ncbi:MAG TPA: SxtJ family membrane protein, partial [Thermoanaerobaculia bacterium]|nr:SxtJ family membrane protein [Thermoanaerobaculia bacterium]
VAAGAVFGSLGLVLILLAAVASALLTWPNRGWMAFARLLGRINTMLFLSIVFFFVLTPVGAFLRLVGRDELRRRRAPSDTMWVPYPARVGDPKHFERMF